jgi:hypothetical protein
MIMQILILLFIWFALLTLGFFIFLHWGTRWGSTSEECALEMPGDVYFLVKSTALENRLLYRYT